MGVKLVLRVQQRECFGDQPDPSQAQRDAAVPKVLSLHQNGDRANRCGDLKKGDGVGKEFVNMMGVMAPVA